MNICNQIIKLIKKFWWMDGQVGVNGVLRIDYSNQKALPDQKSISEY